ncbi:MAG TPA: hypothetical protein PLP27_12925 [Crocinitomicaceae bacterium]|nr:hypothetical protein [Crocinitomicaceae bacterium]
MKKIILGGIVVFSMISCAKDRTCVCEGTNLETDTPINYPNTVNGTKKNATTTCENQSYSNVKAEVTCHLK